VVVEDAPAGVAAANAAGMVSVGLTSTGRTRADLAAAATIVGTLGEISAEMLRDVIDRRN
jgi:beta-phosphoglucomutase-like phosphatase (HAD superfamily)